MPVPGHTTYRVEMTAFGKPGEVREVDVPTEKVEGKPVEEVLGQIFYYGQNDFQPKKHCSVSVADIINVGDDKYVVAPVGFRKLTKEQYDEFLKVDRRDRSIHEYVRGNDD